MGENRVRFDVYERDGRLAGSLVTGLLSAEQSPEAVPTPTVRGDRIWMVVTDELGVDYVVRARIVGARDVDVSGADAGADRLVLPERRGWTRES